MKRLYSLDAFRGLAALTIVMWHWQHFFAVSGQWAPVWQRDWQPFWWLLQPFYLQAWAAVDLFFALSGFVFFWLYGQAIRDGKIAAGKFALLRFSRLYPLQLLTLLVITGVQAMFQGATGDYFIFPAGDWTRFVAHFFMVHQLVPPNTDQTFNGPASLETSGGSMTLSRIDGKLEASTSGGSIELAMIAPVPGEVSLSTSGGNLNLEAPENAAFNIDAHTSGGHVSCDLPVSVKGKLESERLNGTINGGGPDVVLRTGGGNIRVQKSDVMTVEKQ